MRTYFFLFLLLSLQVSAQVGSSQLDKQARVYRFVQEHLDAIRKYTRGEGFNVQLQFNDALVLDSVTYKPFRLDSSGKLKIEETKRVKIWPELDAFIRQSYAFFPSTSFERDYGKTTGIAFAVPLDEKNLTSGLENLKEQRQVYNKAAAEDELKGVVRDAPYTLDIKMAARGKFFPRTNFSGLLSTYNSEAIEIGTGYYLVFNVVTTSVGGMLRQKVQYSVYHVFGKSSELLFKNVSDVTDNKANLEPPADDNDVITIEGEVGNFEMNGLIQFSDPNPTLER